MSNMNKLKAAFDTAIANDPAVWGAPISSDPGAPLRKDVISNIFKGQDAQLIELMIDERVASGEKVKDIAKQMMTEILTI